MIQQWNVLFLDLDGTLIGRDIQVSTRVRRALEDAAAIGTVLCANTGRSLAESTPILEQLPPFQYAVTCNGARVTRLTDGVCLTAHQLPESTCLAIIDLLREFACFSPAYLGDNYYRDAMAFRAIESMPELLPYMQSTGGLAGRTEDYSVLFERLGEFPSKFYVVTLPDRVEQLRRRLVELDGLYVTGAGTYNHLEVVPLGVDKGTGLEIVCADLGYSPADAMAIGDSYNDVDMLRTAGFGVAMGDAPAELVRVAQCVTGSCKEDGAAHAIERYLLGREAEV